MLELFTSALAPSVVPLFVYGTLRPHGVLSTPWLGESVVDHQPAIARGFGLYAPSPAWFPFLVHETGQVAQGDVLWVKRGPELMRTALMEINVGYTMELVDVELDNLHEPLQVAAFVWRGGTENMHPVPHNDWYAT